MKKTLECLIILKWVGVFLVVINLIVGIPWYFVEQNDINFKKEQQELAGECGIIPTGVHDLYLGSKVKVDKIQVDRMTYSGIIVKDVDFDREGYIIQTNSLYTTITKIGYDQLPDILPKYKATADCMLKKYSSQDLKNSLKNNR